MILHLKGEAATFLMHSCQPAGPIASSGALGLLFCSPSYSRSPALACRASSHRPAQLLSLPLALRPPLSARGQSYLICSSPPPGSKATRPLLPCTRETHPLH